MIRPTASNDKKIHAAAAAAAAVRSPWQRPAAVLEIEHGLHDLKLRLGSGMTRFFKFLDGTEGEL